MTYQFKSEVTAGDFWKLTMSRTYRSVAGVCNMVFTVAMILFTAKFFRTSGDLMQMLMLFGCLLFPVIQPIAIYLKAKGQAKTMPKDVELSFDDAGLHVTVGKEKESIGWKKLRVANFIFGCTFAVPAGLIYRYKSVKSRKHAVIGMAVGTVLTAVVACFINAFVLLPAYGKAFGMPVEAFIEMGSAVHSSVNNLLTFAAMIIFPFNIFKYALTSLIVFLIYKRIRVVLKGD